MVLVLRSNPGTTNGAHARGAERLLRCRRYEQGCAARRSGVPRHRLRRSTGLRRKVRRRALHPRSECVWREAEKSCKPFLRASSPPCQAFSTGRKGEPSQPALIDSRDAWAARAPWNVMVDGECARCGARDEPELDGAAWRVVRSARGPRAEVRDELSGACGCGSEAWRGSARTHLSRRAETVAEA